MNSFCSDGSEQKMSACRCLLGCSLSASGDQAPCNCNIKNNEITPSGRKIMSSNHPILCPATCATASLRLSLHQLTLVCVLDYPHAARGSVVL